MNIIDFERKGNVVRFYLGENGEQWGDDWNDAPYDCNAGKVYSEFVQSHHDISFSFDSEVYEPSSDSCAVYYCKEDMIKRVVPCIIVVPDHVILKEGGYWGQGFDYWAHRDDVTRIYFGDSIVSIWESIGDVKNVKRSHPLF